MMHNKHLNDPLEDMLGEVPFGQHSAGTEDDPSVALARRMRAVDLSHRSGIRLELREHLLGDKSMTIKPIMWQRMAAVAALALLLIAAALLGPGRGFAEEILGQLGVITITSDNPEYEVEGFDPTAPTATPISPEGLIEGWVTTTGEGTFAPVSVSEVAEASGISPIYEASRLPEGYEFRGWQVYLGEGDAVQVSSIWSRAGDMSGMDQVHIMQMRNWPPYSYQTGREAQAEAVSVADREALLITNADLDASDGRLFTIVVIEAGEDTLVVLSPGLDAETLLSIAESLFE